MPMLTLKEVAGELRYPAEFWPAAHRAGICLPSRIWPSGVSTFTASEINRTLYAADACRIVFFN